MIHCVTFGIIVDDIVFPTGQTRMGVLGGGGPQTAWGMAAALGSGETVGLAAGIGSDLEADVLAPLHAAHVNLAGVRVTAQPTPRAWQLMEWNGRRTQVWRVPPSTLGLQLARRWDVLPGAYQEAHIFHWGIHPGEAGSLDFAQELHARGALVSLEPFRPSDGPMSDDALSDLLAACAVFSPNWHEAQIISGHKEPRAVLARFRALGGRVLVIRHGANGADIWALDEGRGVRVPAVQTTIVDEVGAGNAFCGALVARLPDGIEAAACHASAAASYLVEQIGLPPALPDPAEYARRLEQVRAGLVALALDDHRA